MSRRTARLRRLLLLGAASLVAVATLGLHAGGALERLELESVDARFDLRGEQRPAGEVVVVGIDDRTFNALDDDPRHEGQDVRWPFPRRFHADVVANLDRAGARVIAYDVQFTEESDDVEGDSALIEAVREAGNVVLATTEVEAGGRTKVFGGGEGLAYSRGVAANSNYVNDDDGTVRRTTLRLDGLETFPLAAARLADRSLAAPPDATPWIDFLGPPGTLPRLSFVDVMNGRFSREAVRGKVVVVGATAPSLQDLHATATTGSALMAGPEVQANAIATALRGFPLREAPWWIDVLAIVLLAAIAPAAAVRLRTRVALGIGVVATVAFAAAAQAAFGAGWIVAAAAPLAAGAGGLLVTALGHGVTAAFERERVRETFARFVPEVVVDEVLRDADGVRLGGVLREGTIMFSDLRGFTSFSESTEPEQVIRILNRYMTEMSDAILAHEGTLVTYMGDGIMAVFGAPLVQDDHADRALAAAQEMLERLELFNAWLREQGIHDGFKMGIGLNSGVFMSGNVGSERRLEYTVIGDTTNTAARVEGMTKGTPHQLFLCDSTRQALQRPPGNLEPVGEMEVRGRKARVRIWAPALEAGDEAPPAVAAASGVEERK